MLYYLYALCDINLFQYILFRAGLAFFLSFLICVFAMPRFILWAKRKRASQPISTFIPTHKTKSNTPTMGGAVFIGSSILVSALCANVLNHYVLLSLAVLMLFGIIGIRDDYAKISTKSNRGMPARQKIFSLVFMSLFTALCLCAIGDSGLLYLPFLKNPIVDMGIFAIVFWTIVLVSASNAANITDGLDGLATMPSILAILTLSVFVYISGNATLASYLLIPKVIGVGELFVVSSAVLGALFGFLWFNCHPAQVFMGDSGSLALGGFIAYMGIVSHNEILLIIICSVFVVETISVILQIGSYKIRRKRIFLMAPIHHHFEVKGWNENKIIIRFWIVAILSNLLALMSLKIR